MAEGCKLVWTESRKLEMVRLNQQEERHFHLVFSLVRKLCATETLLSEKRCSDQMTRVR